MREVLRFKHFAYVQKTLHIFGENAQLFVDGMNE